MNTVRWGIVGAGRIAHTFARDIAAVEDATLVAVAARDGDRAAAFAREYGIDKAYGDYDTFYADKEIDAVYIATPHTHHLANSRDALIAGKGVLCEKPLTADVAQCRELLAVARSTGGYLKEAMWTWFLPAIEQAEAWVAQGRIGELCHVKADFGYPQPYHEDSRVYDIRLGGGAVLEMGVYPVALARLFAGGEPKSIQVSGRLADNGVEDDVTAVLDFGQCTATIGTSFRCKLQNWAYVIGTEGYIAIPDFWMARSCSLYHLDERIDHFEDGRSTLGFDYQIAAASRDIVAGRTESERIPLATSLAVQEDMAQIIALARSA